MANILQAIKNIIENPILDLENWIIWSNRINNVWNWLEDYIKNIFANSFNKTEFEKMEIFSEIFSYLWNKNNPPDIILKNSDAIEVKKIESYTNSIALNSSFPKDRLYHNDTRITNDCRNCENTYWDIKDIIYAIWVAPKNNLKTLLFIYGDCFCADKEIYERIINKISSWISEISDIELVKTNEIAKVKKVDPLWITDLRVRGMWHIENPLKIFSEIFNINKDKNFNFICLILSEKYNSFPEIDRKNLEDLQNENFFIKDVIIKSPNNPAKILNAKCIKYEQ